MPSSSSRTTQRPASLNTLRVLLYVFVAIAAVLWLIPLFAAHSVLYPPGPKFEDIVVYKGRFTLYHSAKFFTSHAFSGFAYPAGAAPIYEFFYKTANPTQTYLLLAALTTTVTLAGAALSLYRSKALSLFLPLLLISSFPLVFLIQRANIEIILWLLVVGGILACRQRLAIPGAILFGLAAAVKLYPIFLLGLFLKSRIHRNKYDIPAFVAGVITFILAMSLAIVHTGPTFLVAARGFFTGVNRFQDHYVDQVTRVELVFDHCLFSPLKYWAFTNHTTPAPYTHTYLLVAGLFAVALFLRVRTLPFLNRVLFLTAAMVALPPVSFTYTLVHLYVPLLLLLCSIATTYTRPPASSLAAVALLLFLTLPFVSAASISTLSTGPIQSVALFLLLILATIQPWPSVLHAEAE